MRASIDGERSGSARCRSTRLRAASARARASAGSTSSTRCVTTPLTNSIRASWAARAPPGVSSSAVVEQVHVRHQDAHLGRRARPAQQAVTDQRPHGRRAEAEHLRLRLRRFEASSDSQNACGSCSWRPSDTHAARSPRPSASIHERTRNVFPLPAGAETCTNAPPRPAAQTGPAAESTTSSHQGRSIRRLLPGRPFSRGSSSSMSAAARSA
jgi:hypothetical protein